ncbi:MAG TPA: hypothetical protein VF203_02175 [Burkholderiales bacterium]
MDSDAVLGHAEIVRELERLHREGRSGTARVATPDNQLLQVVFSEGAILSVTFGTRQNVEAIRQFAAARKGGRLRFSEGKVRVPEGAGPLPDTITVLRMLGVTDPLGGVATAASGPAALAAVESEAVEFLGPMASIVWEEQLARIGNPDKPGALQRLIDALAREIGRMGDADKAEQFRAAVARKLGTK